jgi:ABC-type proline/glycine betaine transport system ATPase subunit
LVSAIEIDHFLNYSFKLNSCHYDKVVCLDHGELLALDTPAAMLKDPESMFAKLVVETGEQSARNMRLRADESEVGSHA